MLFFWTFYKSKNPEKERFSFHKNIKEYNIKQFSTWLITKKDLLSTKSACYHNNNKMFSYLIN